MHKLVIILLIVKMKFMQWFQNILMNIKHQYKKIDNIMTVFGQIQKPKPKKKRNKKILNIKDKNIKKWQ